MQTANPKETHGNLKPGLSCLPLAPLLFVGQVMRNGARKYGRMNWRGTKIHASTYLDAIWRHLLLWWDGYDLDDNSNLPHLAHVAANCILFMDAQMVGAVEDDRQKVRHTRELINILTQCGRDDLQDLLREDQLADARDTLEETRS
jgi:hypothetical protein